MIYRTLALWSLLVISCFGQFSSPGKQDENENVTVSQVTFLTADAVEVAEAGKRVAILAEGLDAKQEYGVVLTTKMPARWIEVHPVEKPFPPIVEQPYKDNKFLIRGKPGEKFNVSVRGIDIPVWVEVTIAPSVAPPKPEDPKPEDPKPPVSSDVKELSKQLSSQLADPPTASALKTALLSTVSNIEALCNQRQCPTLDSAKNSVQNTINTVLQSRKTPNKDWYRGWREPVSKAIADKKVTTTSEYIAWVRAAAEGL